MSRAERVARATTTLNTTTALSAWERSADRAQPIWRRLLIWAPGWILFYLVFVVIIGHAALDAWLDKAGYHVLLYLVITGLIAVCFTLATVFTFFGDSRSITTRSRRAGSVLREVALVGNARLAPLADPQPTKPTFSEPLIQSMELGPLTRGSSARREETSSLRTLALILVLVVALTFADSTMYSYLPGNNVRLAVGIVTAFLIGLALIGAVMNVYWSILQAAKDMRVTVDAHGVRWRASWLAGWRSIAWDEARAFARIAYAVPMQSIGFPEKPIATVYALDAPGATLLWMEPADKRAATYEPAQRLIQLVSAHTQLPLRDLSALAGKLTQPKRDPARVLASAIAESGVTDVPVALLALTQPARRTPVAYLLLAYLALMSLGLWALVALGVYLFLR